MSLFTFADAAAALDKREPSFLHGRFFGLASETKPTTLDDGTTSVPAGCVFDEIDTGRRYWFTGETWMRVPVKVDNSEKMLAALESLTSEINSLRTLLELKL